MLWAWSGERIYFYDLWVLCVLLLMHISYSLHVLLLLLLSWLPWGLHCPYRLIHGGLCLGNLLCPWTYNMYWNDFYFHTSDNTCPMLGILLADETVCIMSYPGHPWLCGCYLSWIWRFWFHQWLLLWQLHCWTCVSWSLFTAISCSLAYWRRALYVTSSHAFSLTLPTSWPQSVLWHGKVVLTYCLLILSGVLASLYQIFNALG